MFRSFVGNWLRNGDRLLEFGEFSLDRHWVEFRVEVEDDLDCGVNMIVRIYWSFREI